ncbi:MAG: glycosyltransferase family 1 protein [Candidatus Shapirobacteria bacterium]
MKKYKIAIDVSPLSDGNAIRGVGYYTKNLVTALQHEVKTNPDYKDIEISLIKNYKLKIKNFDLVHYPYFDPFFLTLPITKTPFVVTVHDLVPIEIAKTIPVGLLTKIFPQGLFKNIFPIGIKGFIRWQIQKTKLRFAKYILTPTHTAKYSICDILGYPKEKIFTTYEAANSNFKKITDQKLLQSIKTKYNLPDVFVLYVGDIGRNKNIPSLANACQKINIPLIIAGSSAVKPVPDDPWTKDIKWVQAHQSKYLKSLGFVSDDDLPVLYNLASVYCQPSFAEGFGLPLLEAMQCGTPTCYSQQTSLAEISDFSGLSFDPYSIKDISNKIKLILTDTKLQQELIIKGYNRAKTFSWQLCAINTLAVYRLCQLDVQK